MEEIEWFTPDEIFSSWWSIDFGPFGRKVTEWKDFVKIIKKDPQYKAVKESILKYGFRRPLFYCYEGIKEEDGFTDVISHGDGHHRMVAAIELGYKWLPYIEESHTSKDSWNFRRKDQGEIKKITTVYLHDENPLPKYLPKNVSGKIPSKCFAV